MKNKKTNLVSVVIVTKDRKKDLLECVKGYINSSYKNIEIIVVDNASNPPLVTWLTKEYPKIKLITNDENIGAAEGRNQGYLESKGDYVLFTDDDAYPDKDMIKHLVEAFKKKKNAGIVQPLVYDKQKKTLLQGAGHDINTLTGRITAWGVQEEDKGQYDGLREVPLCGCVWMVKRAVFKKIGLYDEDYFIPYEDSDFSKRSTEAGFVNYAYSKAKTWHQGRKTTFVHPRVEYLGITSASRAYRIIRNKIIYIRKHSTIKEKLFFYIIMLPIYLVVHSTIIFSTLRFDLLLRYWLGFIAGIMYSIYYPFLKYRKNYHEFDKKLYEFKMLLLAWTDPITWVIDRKSETILDLACGQGKPMYLIKKRMNVKYAEGVDLFEPYIKEAREQKIHDKYVFMDIRDINYKDNSFDIVIASHVLEHMPEKDAWKLLAKMEKIAKRQVIIATPIGEMYHPAVDGNELQIHHCHFYPKDYEKKGYKTLKYGWRWLLGDHGIVHRVRNDLGRKFLYTLNILLTPVYYTFQSLSDYTFVAYKDTTQLK